jgi:hypothetical protein
MVMTTVNFIEKVVDLKGNSFTLELDHDIVEQCVFNYRMDLNDLSGHKD